MRRLSTKHGWFRVEAYRYRNSRNRRFYLTVAYQSLDIEVLPDARLITIDVKSRKRKWYSSLDTNICVRLGQSIMDKKVWRIDWASQHLARLAEKLQWVPGIYFYRGEVCDEAGGSWMEDYRFFFGRIQSVMY